MTNSLVRLFLAGDAMTGRGVDQILSHPASPGLHEPYVDDAREYVRLAEQTSGTVPRRVAATYIWGDALAEWARMQPAARVVNLETSITRTDGYDRAKSIHYRMNPANVGCLTAARFDMCVLANNHVLDYGRPGLIETLDTLKRAGILTAGAGHNLDDAARPGVRALPGGARLVAGAYAHESSGVPAAWAAREAQPGVNLLPGLGASAAAAVAGRVAGARRPGDIAVVSIHWGGNWGYDVPDPHVEFAHRLVEGGIDVVYGHSSHHVRPLEIYRGKLILYGTGDFIDDYEGISGFEQYRDDLVLMFFPCVDPGSGGLAALQMIPLQIRGIRLHRASARDARWLCETLNRISGPFGVHVSLTRDRTLTLDEPLDR